MGFFRDKADSVQANIEAGDLDAASRDIVHVMLEGGGSDIENLNRLTEEKPRSK